MTGPNAPLSIRFNYIRLIDKKIVLYTSILWPSLADKEKILAKAEETWAASPMEVRQRRRLDGYYIDPKDPGWKSWLELPRTCWVGRISLI